MRAVWLLLGATTLAVVWFVPLGPTGMGPFAAHMTVHMGVVAVAAPLLSLAARGSAVDLVARAPRFFAPIPASLLELVVVWAFHTPALHHAARHSTSGLLAEQTSFFASGMLVWLSALGGAGARTKRRAAGVVALLLTSMHMTLLGALLALAPRPLYSHAHATHAQSEAQALSPLSDQHLGGAIMLLVGGVAYLAGGLGLSAAVLRARASGRAELVAARATGAHSPEMRTGP